LSFTDGAFDIATSNAVLEHVGSLAAQAAFVCELLRVGRLIFIGVPHRFFPIEPHRHPVATLDRSLVRCRLLGTEQA
jgi:hypothetical protein